MQLNLKIFAVFVFVITTLLLGCTPTSIHKNEETQKYLEDNFFLEVPKEERLRILEGEYKNTYFIEYVGTPSISLSLAREKWHIHARKVCSEKSYKHVLTKNWMESARSSKIDFSNNHFDPNLYCNAAGVMDCIIGGALGLILVDKLLNSEKNKDDKFPFINGKVTCES